MIEIKPIAWMCKDYPPFLPKGEFAWRLTMDEPVNYQGDALVLHSDYEAEVARLRAEVEKYRADVVMLLGAIKKIASGELDGYRPWIVARDAAQRVNDSGNAAMGEGK